MKKIVLLSMSFFGYEEIIRTKIEELGNKCQLVKSEPRFSMFDSLCKKFDKNRYVSKTLFYIHNVVKEIHECDELIIIFSPNLSQEAIAVFRKKFPKVNVTYYIWDSVNNFPNVLKIAKGCDRVLSFDRNDCMKYGFEFLPLFYSDNTKLECKKEFDYSMIFSIYPSKVKNYEMLRKAIPKSKIGYTHIYVPSKMFYYYQLFYPVFRAVKHSDVKSYALPKETVYDTFRKSLVTIDCPLESQSGLTMRTFEALSMGIKLVTTNKDIANYNFYSSDNIFIVDKEHNEIPDEFFNSPFDYSYDMSDYSLESFVNRLMGNAKR